ncbi:DUF2007 domain-containing protein [Paraglaciecola aquimarina]|uniref:DUF2007 domain-containing protein n=1 Tax=Paraglaciecola algarum TaxID=3050085 RepID=A0ABS9D8P1_9ALTE|nr:DUF2007 domain-containing protein [Paraglaciecola sp. G1-23]MCF2948368.1 DUF2007 domain-containing protein [Paraglaciecola sp. G1-23]
MEKVFFDGDRFRIWQVKQLLEEKGIACFIKNEFAIGAMGELSPMDVLPEVWIYDPQWLPKAKVFIEEFLAQPIDLTPWYCTKCQEQNEPSFEVCWKCTTNRPD